MPIAIQVNKGHNSGNDCRRIMLIDENIEGNDKEHLF
jgi:hypothetical protein